MTICGKSLAEIRKSYFKGELKKLLNEIQSEGCWSEKDIEKLATEIEILKSEDDKNAKIIREKVDGNIFNDSKPPSADEIMEGVNDLEWREKADRVIEFVNQTLDNLRLAIQDKKKILPTYWLDTSSVFLSFQGILDRDLVYKESLYRKRITNFIDNFGMSRAESEERARMSKEYADYKEIVNLRDRIERFEMLAKKYDNKQNNY